MTKDSGTRVRVCPAGNGHCLCRTTFCPAQERLMAIQGWRSDAQQLTRMRIESMRLPTQGDSHE